MKASFTFRVYLMSEDTRKSAMRNKKGSLQTRIAKAPYHRNPFMLLIFYLLSS